MKNLVGIVREIALKFLIGSKISSNLYIFFLTKILISEVGIALHLFNYLLMLFNKVELFTPRSLAYILLQLFLGILFVCIKECLFI